MGKTISYILIALALISIVCAVEFEYRYSPYTGKLDRTRSTNQSGNNITADNAEFTNLLVENPPVNCSTGYYMIGTNMEESWCMLDDDSDKLENGTTNTVHFGKVGIGTSTPTSELHVIGEINATAYIGNGSQLTGLDEYAKYQFTDNNFNGSGNLTTTGDIDGSFIQSLNEGEEIITNGNFDSDLTGWTAGANWAQAGGKAYHTAGDTDELKQSVTLVAGDLYHFKVDVAEVSGSYVYGYIGTQKVILQGGTLSFDGYFIADNAGAQDLKFYSYAGGTWEGTIDNVSLKHVEGKTDLNGKVTMGDADGTEALVHVKGRTFDTPLVYIEQTAQSSGTGWTGSEWALKVDGYSDLGGFRISARDTIRSLHKIAGGDIGISTTNTGNIKLVQSNSHITLQTDSSYNVEMPYDNSKLQFGVTDTDLQISSDGTNPIYNSTGTHTFIGDINATAYIGNGSQLTGLDEYAKYQFTDNNFNGSGNLTTTGTGRFDSLGIGSAPSLTRAVNIHRNYDASQVFGIYNLVTLDRSTSGTGIWGSYLKATYEPDDTMASPPTISWVVGLENNAEIAIETPDENVIVTNIAGVRSFLDAVSESDNDLTVTNSFHYYANKAEMDVEESSGTSTVTNHYTFYDAGNDWATNTWSFYNAGEANSYVGKDNAKLMFGTTNTDLQISSDGTNGIINVSNQLKVLGDLNVTGNITMQSPDGTGWNCGVSNVGVFSCS